MDDTVPEKRSSNMRGSGAIAEIRDSMAKQAADNDRWSSLLEDGELFDASYDPDAEPEPTTSAPLAAKAPKVPKKKAAPRPKKEKPTPKPATNTLAHFSQGPKAPLTQEELTRMMTNEEEELPDVAHLLAQESDFSEESEDEHDELNRILHGNAAPAATPQSFVTPVALAEEVDEALPELPTEPEAPTATPATKHVKFTDEEPPSKVRVKGERNFASVKVEAPETMVKVEPQEAPAPLGYSSVSSRAIPAIPEGNTQLFYWLDAKEIPYQSAVDPGSIIVFGKMKVNDGRFVSCCVRVRNVERFAFALPREGKSPPEVIQELGAMCTQQRIPKRRFKVVQRWYGFECADIPRDKTAWIKLRYSAHYPQLGRVKGETFSHLFGTTQSTLEAFLIKRKLKGPCWIALQNASLVPRSEQQSHCEVEFTIENPKKDFAVNPEQGHPPPMTAFSLHLHCALDEAKRSNEIIAASVFCQTGVDVDATNTVNPRAATFSMAVRQYEPRTLLPMETQEYCRKRGLAVAPLPSERALLEWIVQHLEAADPDFLVGHTFLSYTLDILLHRLEHYKLRGWSLLGRLRLRQFPRLQGGAGGTREATFMEKEVCCGRLVVDTYTLAKEHYKSTSYKLMVLAQQMGLKGVFGAVDEGQVPELVIPDYREALQDCNMIFRIVSRTANFAQVSLALAFNLDAIPLTKRLATIAGNLWGRCLNGARAERIEYLLLHAFHERKFILPDKRGYDAKRGRDAQEEEDGEERGAAGSKAKYKGGMVLEPKKGLYTDYVMLLDFNSLYPSIIQEFNVCFTTVERPEPDPETRMTPLADIPPVESLICSQCKEEGVVKTGDSCNHRCVLPKVIRELVQGRRSVKRLMKTTTDKGMLAQLDIRQKALKLTANSMYGCLGFEMSRFYAQPLAELVTRQGREALQATVDLVPTVDVSLQVIYGDTDSVMIHTGSQDLVTVRAKAEQVKKEVNKRYRNLEIDIDGVFKSILLLRKKKYAALNVVDFYGKGTDIRPEIKGLDMVRRDWCPLSQETSRSVLDFILDQNASSGGQVLDQIMAFMQSVSIRTREGKPDLKKFVINKSLTKEPEQYTSGSNPHVAVAMRMKARHEAVRVGDLIPYVVCDAATIPSEVQQVMSHKDSISKRAFHPDEISASADLNVDIEWYLGNQVYGPVVRLCDQIQGFSGEQLADAMGLRDEFVTKTHASQAAKENTYHSTYLKRADPEDAYPTATPFEVKCDKCATFVKVLPQTQWKAKIASGTGTQRYSAFGCSKCNRHFPLHYLSNCMTNYLRAMQRNFFRCGATEEQEIEFRTQLSYLVTLFKEPTSAPEETKAVYQHSLRLLHFTMKESSRDEVNRLPPSVRDEYVDPLEDQARRLYKAMERNWVNPNQLFIGMGAMPEPEDEAGAATASH